jgi:hypothetical protein
MMSQARRIDYFLLAVGRGLGASFEVVGCKRKFSPACPLAAPCPARGRQALISCRKSRFTFLNSRTPASKLFSSPEHQATFVHPEYLESLCLFGRVAHAAITKLVSLSHSDFCLHCTLVLPFAFCLSPFLISIPNLRCSKPISFLCDILHTVTMSSGPIVLITS